MQQQQKQERAERRSNTNVGLINQQIQEQLLPQHRDQVSDGFHSFKQLYAHRIALFIMFCRALIAVNVKNEVWRSKTQSDGTTQEGWFLLGTTNAKGEQITYHLPESEWDRCEFAETLDQAPAFDGHTSDDVLSRLQNWG